MSEQRSHRFLSQLSTCWSVVQRAHSGPGEGQCAAREELLRRYGGAVSRYLHGALRDPIAAQDLYQEFALRFLRGDFHRATPENGRFRDFVKTALLRMVARHSARGQSGPRTLETDVCDATPTPSDLAEQQLIQS